VGYENKVNEKGERLIWLEPSTVDRLRAMRGPGESYSDVILRLAAEGGGGPLGPPLALADPRVGRRVEILTLQSARDPMHRGRSRRWSRRQLLGDRRHKMSPTGSVGYWLGEFVDDGHLGGGEANRHFVPPKRASQLGIVGPVDSGENDSSSLSVAT
jgi:hypothetical protein